MKLLAKLTGGRPMRYIAFAFTDCATNDNVNYYHDLFGRLWLATSRWSLFRTRVSRKSI